ncbi:DUF2069 domain-containing protein [Dyella silvae]|uniref:DUF2069 domain-containing protein n=1 Tax=Dyella silvae TaxID=2994424 RepID=UPI0022640D24|nr:DUF2069 domain-containing protein [Dyella silvae]
MSAPVAPAYRVGLVAWAALAALQPIWHGWLFPTQSMPVAVALAITFIPLLLPLLAIRNVPRALLWVGILSLFYFCHGISEAWSAPGERVLAWIEVLLTLTLIGTLGLGVRYKRPASRT